MLKKIEIQHNAIKYIKGELGLAGDFGRTIAENLDIDQGRVFVYLPEILRPYVEEFQNSILYYVQEIEGESIHERLVINEIVTKPRNLVFQYLQKNAEGCAIFETFYRAKDNRKYFKSFPYIIFNNDVLWFLTQDKADRKTIDRCFGARKAYPSIIGLSTLPVSWKQNIYDQEIQNAAFHLLVEKLDYLLVASFDNETFLVWER